MVVIPLNERSASMARHPAGKKRAKVVYSTTTGEPSRGSLTRTTEATSPLPPPVKAVRKTTVKKHKPRIRMQSTRLEKHIIVNPMVLAEAKRVVRKNEKFVPVDNTTMRSVYL